MGKQAVLVFNPAAGRSSLWIRRLDRVVTQIEAIGIRVELQDSCPEDRKQRAERLKGKDLLVICGGDGTIHDVLPEAIQAGLPVAILPAGTANVLARELGIPRHWEDAVQVLKEGNCRVLRLGKANGKYFHLMAGIGADGYIIQRVGPSLKRFLGVAAFWVIGFARFWNYPLRSFRVDFGSESHSATFAVVSNARFYGRHLLLAPHASVFEDSLDVCLFTSQEHLRFLHYLWGSLTGRHLHFPDVIYRKVKELEVVGDATVSVQLDGEVAGTLPMGFVSAEDTLEVMVP